MKIVAESQASVNSSYIHLAYISAQLNNRISKGELLPGQAILGLAIATAVLCGAIEAKLAKEGRRGRAARVGGVLGFFAALGLLWLVQTAWSQSRSNEEAVKYVIETKQFWALRNPPIAAGIEAAATTNGAAASLAADYYGLKGGSGKEAPELVVKGYRYCELASSQGKGSRWVSLADFTNEWGGAHVKETFESALQKGKLSEAERAWAKRQLARMAEQTGDENRAEPKQ